MCEPSTSVECRILSCFSPTTVFLQVCSFLEQEMLPSVSQLTFLRIIIYSSSLNLHVSLSHGQSTATSFPIPFPSSFSLLWPHCDSLSPAHKISLKIMKCFLYFAIWLSLLLQQSEADELYPSQPGSGNMVSQLQLNQKLKKGIFTSCYSYPSDTRAFEIVSS